MELLLQRKSMSRSISKHVSHLKSSTLSLEFSNPVLQPIVALAFKQYLHFRLVATAISLRISRNRKPSIPEASLPFCGSLRKCAVLKIGVTLASSSFIIPMLVGTLVEVFNAGEDSTIVFSTSNSSSSSYISSSPPSSNSIVLSELVAELEREVPGCSFSSKAVDDVLEPGKASEGVAVDVIVGVMFVFSSVASFAVADLSPSKAGNNVSKLKVTEKLYLLDLTVEK
uniref:Uncharacterized protein n=1 Tax=Glossina brevipalpis TaxID=37001 RepID=A0A1A9WL21_9MUSC